MNWMKVTYDYCINILCISEKLIERLDCDCDLILNHLTIYHIFLSHKVTKWIKGFDESTELLEETNEGSSYVALRKARKTF